MIFLTVKVFCRLTTIKKKVKTDWDRYSSYTTIIMNMLTIEAPDPACIIVYMYHHHHDHEGLRNLK